MIATAVSKATARATVKALKRQQAEETTDMNLAEQLRLLAAEKSRLERELSILRQRVSDLEQENDRLIARVSAHRALTRNAELANSALMYDGREVVNQSEAAKRLGVKQYAVSRWVAAGHFQTARVGARTLIFADSLHTPAKKRRRSS